MQSDAVLEGRLKLGQRTEAHTTRLGGKDHGPQVQGWSVERAYETDLPPAMRAFSGSASAQLSLELGGVGGKSAPALYGPWAPHASGDIVRPGQSVVHRWGVDDRNLPAFRGTIRSRSAASGSDTLSLAALDGAERLRGPARLPNPAPGVMFNEFIASETWCVDYLLRRVGIHSSPPPRSGCILYASMHGGIVPDIGSLIGGAQCTDYTTANAPHAIALQATSVTDDQSVAMWAPRTRTTTRYSGGLWFEAWVNTTGVSGGVFTLSAAWTTPGMSGNSPVFSLVTDFAAGKVTATVGTDGVDTITAFADPLRTQPGTWHIACHLAIAPDGQMSRTLFLTAPDRAEYVATAIAFPTFRINFGNLSSIIMNATRVRVENVQVAKMATAPTGNGITQRGQWVRGARLDAPTSRLQSVPQVSGSAWDVIAEIAKATLSTAEFDEAGVFRWRSRTRFATAATTPAVTVTSARDISSLTLTEEIDAVRNYVRVPFQNWYNAMTGFAEPMYPVDYPAITAGGTASRTFSLPVEDFDPLTPPIPVYALSDSGNEVVFYANGNRINGFVEITGFRDDDGSYKTEFRYVGPSIGDITVFPLRVQPNRLDDFEPSDVQLGLYSEESQRWYGRQNYDHPTTPWLQDLIDAWGLAAQLLSAGKWPVPQLGDVEILPDPRLQLGDAVRVVDRSGAPLDTLAWIVGMRTAGANGAVTQTLTLRGCSTTGTPIDAGVVPDPPVDPSAGSTQ